MGYPNLIAKNQFGEQLNLSILSGTSQLLCNFVVDSANGNGLGIRSLKAPLPPGVAAIYMHTSATPAVGNPNPAAGFIMVKFAAGYAGYFSGFSGFVSPVSGTPINVTSGLSVGSVYVIVSVGTTTAAQWQALGLPTNITPAVGVAFVAITASLGVGSGIVEAPLATGSGVNHIEVVGDPNQSVVTTDNKGGTMMLMCLAATSSGVTTLVATAPADNTVIGLNFIMVPVAAPLI